MVTTIKVNLPKESYPLFIAENILEEASLLQAYIAERQVLVVTNETLAPLYLKQLSPLLQASSQYHEIILPDGEKYKNFESFQIIVDSLIQHRYRRNCLLIALGGGVIGDLTGFAAACYMRGVDYIQIPTSLLAMVDAAVGGKTAINHRAGKNLIGAFHQPKAVFIASQFLKTLPYREYRAGLAEVLKYSLIADQDFFIWLEENWHDILAPDAPINKIIFIIQQCCTLKAKIVAEDAYEQTGHRVLLNFGHTYGHVLEMISNYQLLHGEAVAYGMLLAAQLSLESGLLQAEDYERIYKMVQDLSLPSLAAYNVDHAEVVSLMMHDKKREKGLGVQFVLLRELGSAYIKEITDLTRDLNPSMLRLKP